MSTLRLPAALIVRFRAARAGRDEGFTLLELLVVLAILGLLYAIVAPQALKFLGRASTQTAQVQVRNIASAVNLFQLDVGRPPTQQEGLQALLTQPAGLATWNGPYLERAEALNDPWGHPYQYRIPGENGRPYDVFTLGADNAPGGTGSDKDISS